MARQGIDGEAAVSDVGNRRGATSASRALGGASGDPTFASHALGGRGGDTFAIDVRLPLDRFDLAVCFQSAGRVVGVFGASGSGKTSLLESIAGLRRGVTGSIRVGDALFLDSEAGRRMPPEARGIGYVPQDGLLFPHLSVRGNLRSGAARAARAGVDPAERLASVASLLEIGELLDRGVGSLSGGERQRVALGRALCSGPRLLLLDEPLAALDLPLRRRLLPVLRRLRSAFPTPILLVSHDPVEVQALCDDLVVLDAGRVIAHGDPRAVLSDPMIYPLAEVDMVRTVLPGRIERHDGATSTIRLAVEERGTALGAASSDADARGDRVDDGGERFSGHVGIEPVPHHDGAERVPGHAGIRLVTMPASGVVGAEVLVSIAAREIILALTPPAGLSARNILPATVSAVRVDAARALVSAVLANGVPPIAIEITRATVQEMDLAAGRAIHLIIKSASCRLIE